MSDLTEADVRPLREVKAEMVARALTVTGGNTSRAAALLGVSRKTTYNLAKAYGIVLPDRRRLCHRCRVAAPTAPSAPVPASVAA